MNKTTIPAAHGSVGKLEKGTVTFKDALTRTIREEDTLLDNLVFGKNSDSLSFFCLNASLIVLDGKAHSCKDMEEVKIENSNNFIVESSEGALLMLEALFFTTMESFLQ